MNRGAVAGVGLGLVAFLILLRPLGFVAAATALFVIVGARVRSTAESGRSRRLIPRRQ